MILRSVGVVDPCTPFTENPPTAMSQPSATLSAYAKYVRAFNCKIPLDQISFDYDCSEGQIRPLDAKMVELKRADIDLSPPMTPVRELLMY